MEIKVLYSDYNKEVKNASIDLGKDQSIEIGYVETPVEALVGDMTKAPTEDVAENIVNVNTTEVEPEKKIEIKYIDESLSLEISSQMSFNEVIKYIALLQRFAKQL